MSSNQRASILNIRRKRVVQGQFGGGFLRGLLVHFSWIFTYLPGPYLLNLSDVLIREPCAHCSCLTFRSVTPAMNHMSIQLLPNSITAQPNSGQEPTDPNDRPSPSACSPLPRQTGQAKAKANADQSKILPTIHSKVSYGDAHPSSVSQSVIYTGSGQQGGRRI